MTDALERLAEAEAEVARIKREIANGPCRQYGHSWKLLGGRNAGCGKDCRCSVSVYSCKKCGDSDYGDNAEASLVIAECGERRALQVEREGDGEV